MVRYHRARYWRGWSRTHRWCLPTPPDRLRGGHAHQRNASLVEQDTLDVRCVGPSPRDTTVQCGDADERSYFWRHRAAAAFFAISDRRFFDKDAARAGPPIFPPIRPNAAAAARISSVIS